MVTPNALDYVLPSIAQQAGQAPSDAAEARRRNRDKRLRRIRKEAKRDVHASADTSLSYRCAKLVSHCDFEWDHSDRLVELPFTWQALVDR